MFEHGFPKHWSTLKKLIWLKGAGIIGGASAIWKTVTGALIHITDALASPMQKCEVTLEPIQDLHGQDAPYPAGGGKQLFDKDAVAVGCYTPDNGSFNNYGLHSDYIKVTSGQSISTNKIKAQTTTDGEQTFFSSWTFWDENKQFVSGTWNASNTITVPNNAAYLVVSTSRQIGTAAGNFSESVATDFIEDYTLAVGTNIPTYSPYSNICPITGWTGCEVHRTGVNVWDEEWESGGINDTTGEDATVPTQIRSKNYISCKSNTEYYAKVDTNLDTTSLYIYFYDAVKGFISRAYVGAYDIKNKVITTPANCYYMRFKAQPNQSPTTYYNNISINYPSTDTDYHAYSGTTASVTFPDSAGTVYGGTVDLVSGVLTVKMASVDMGTLPWVYISNVSNPYFQVFFIGQDAPKRQTRCLTSIGFEWKSTINGSTTDDFAIAIPDNGYLRVRDTRFNDADSFKSAMSGVQLVYELATPITIQLTSQEISTLKGENNVWSNTNGDTTVIYKAQAE